MNSSSKPNVMNQDVFSLIKAIREKMTTNIVENKSLVTDIPKPILENIKKIKAICNKNYADQSYYGSAALNRQMLLDKDLADLLTPETLKYIFLMDIWAERGGIITKEDGRTRIIESRTNHPLAIHRNSTGYISMADALCFGFSEGMKTINFIPNNEPDYSPTLYKDQQKRFHTVTTRIVENINTLATQLGLALEDHLTNSSTEPLQLLTRFKRVAGVIARIKDKDKNDQLLNVPGYTPKDIKDQVINGFETMLTLISEEKQGKPTSLDDLADRFIRNENVLLDGWVIHGFYDRAHMEAGIELDTQFKIGDNNYTFSEILERMISKCQSNLADPQLKIAIEQFDVRLQLVENDLKNRFTDEFSAELAQEKIKLEEEKKGEEKLSSTEKSGLAFFQKNQTTSKEKIAEDLNPTLKNPSGSNR